MFHECSASDEAVLLASTAQLEAALRGQLEDGLPDLRGLLPKKVAATTPTPPPWVVSCKTCRRVVLASKFRYEGKKKVKTKMKQK